MIVISAHYLLIYSSSFWLFLLYLVCISQILLLQNLSTKKNRYLSIVFLTFESCLVNKFNQPLNNRKNVIDIETLKLERLETIGTFHIDQGVANMLRYFDFLTYLHFIIVFDLDLKV